MSDDENADRLRVTLDLRSAVAIAIAIASLFTVTALLRAAPGALTLIVVGVLLALALDPLVKGVQRRLRGLRLVAVAIVATVVTGAFVALIVAMGPPAIDQVETFSEELPETVSDLYDLPLVGSRLESFDAAGKAQSWVEDLPDRFDDERIADTVRSVVDGAANGAAVLIVAFAVLLDGEVLVRRGRALVPERFHERADGVGRVFYRIVGTYFAGSLLVAVISAVYMLAVGLAVGVPLAPLAAVWYAVIRLIPQIGGFLGVSVFTVLALSQGVFTGLIALVLAGLYMNLENYVITPAVVGRSVDLSPPTTMIATIVGAAVLGVPGALIGIPLVGTAKALYLEYRFGEEIDYGRQPGGILRRISLPGPLARLLPGDD